MPNPRDIFLPRLVAISSPGDVKQRMPIRNTITAIKKVCTVIICRLIKLKEPSSFFQLKYFGNAMWTIAKAINRIPIIFR